MVTKRTLRRSVKLTSLIIEATSKSVRICYCSLPPIRKALFSSDSLTPSSKSPHKSTSACSGTTIIGLNFTLYKAFPNFCFSLS